MRRDEHRVATTEAEARATPRAFVGVGDSEPWIAGRPWKAAPGGWTVAGELQGWRFRLEVAPGGGKPAVWFVPRVPRPQQSNGPPGVPSGPVLRRRCPRDGPGLSDPTARPGKPCRVRPA